MKRHFQVSPVNSARALALLADVLQVWLFPVFLPGALSWLDDALDVAVAVALIRLLGWHWVFLPTFVAEAVPGVNLVPSWTLAVYLVTRRGPRGKSATRPPEMQSELPETPTAGPQRPATGSSLSITPPDLPVARPELPATPRAPADPSAPADPRGVGR